ncbi:MAG: maleylacetoacetate isomerase [Stappiaceae bacterium]
MSDITLFDYWRSSASYRVRIALNLSGLDYRLVSINLLEKEHKSEAYLARNPQGLVPALEIDGHVLTSSLAIIEYLDSKRGLGLLPQDPVTRAHTQALAHSLAIDIHPVCNLSVVAYAADIAEGKDNVREDWMKHFIRPGLRAFETLLSRFDQTPYCTGNAPGLADICLIPQIYNADRWGVDYADCPKIITVVEACRELAAFQDAHPDRAKEKAVIKR